MTISRPLSIHFRDEMDNNSSQWRIETPMRELAKRGHKVSRSCLLDPLVPKGAGRAEGLATNCFPIEEIDLFVYSRPSTNVHLAEIRQLNSLGIPVISEIDDLYEIEHLDPLNPAYLCYHPKSVNEAQKKLFDEGELDPATYHNDRLDNLHESYRLADAMTVSTDALAVECQKYNDVYVLPNSWDDSNPSWIKGTIEHGGVWVYYGGSLGHLKDFRILKGCIEPAFRKHKQAKLVIAGDQRLLNEIDIADDRKMFFQYQSFSSYPLVAKHGDIFLAPLANTKFNRCRSDIRLLEAGIVGSPWIASKMPQYEAWDVGGRIASKPSEWIRNLGGMLEHPSFRHDLAAEAQAKVRERAISATIAQWEEVYWEVIEKKLSRGKDSHWARWRFPES